jgi:aspartate racemase
MGPLATADLLEKIVRATPAEADQQHLPVVVWSDPRVPPRSEAILGSGASPLEAMREGLRALERAGAEGVAIACNTAHHWAAELMEGSTLELLHIAAAVAAALERRGGAGRPVGLLATAGTARAGFYQSRLGRAGCEVRVPAPAQQEQVQRGILAVKRGRPAEGAPGLAAVAEALLDGGADTVILACTEIPIALREAPESLRRRCLDATDALAARCVEWARSPVSGPGRWA